MEKGYVPDGAAQVEHMGLAARIAGVLMVPRETFAAVAADPRWLAVLALGTGMVAALSAVLVSADFAQRAMIDQQVASMEAFGVTVTDEMYSNLEEQLAIAPYTTVASIMIGTPLVCVVLAGLFHAVGYGLLGAGASFRQVFAAVAHAGVIFAAAQLFIVPLNYVRESITSPTTLGAFVPMLDDETFAYKLLSTIDLVHVWWLATLAIGLAVIWKRRRTTPIATALYGIYAGIVLTIAVLRTNFGF